MSLHDTQGRRLYLTADERRALIAAAATADRPARKRSGSSAPKQQMTDLRLGNFAEIRAEFETLGWNLEIQDFYKSPSGNDIQFLKAPLLSNFTSGLFSWAQAVKATLWWAFVYNQGVLKPYFPMIAANKNILLLVQRPEMKTSLPKCFFSRKIISGQTLSSTLRKSGGVLFPRGNAQAGKHAASSRR
jgi:hypothetical protein